MQLCYLGTYEAELAPAMNETDNTGTMRNAGEDVEELLSCSELILVHSVVLVFMWFQPTESLCARIAIISSSKGVCWPCR